MNTESWFCCLSSPCFSSSLWSPLSCTAADASSALGAGAGVRDSSSAVGRGPTHHLLSPLTVAGLLQAAACRLNWQRAGGDGREEATAAVHWQSQVHRGLQHHLQDEAHGQSQCVTLTLWHFCAVLSLENKVLPGQQTELLGHQPWPFHCLFPILKLWSLLGIPAEFQKYIGGCQFSNSALQMCFTQ